MFGVAFLSPLFLVGALAAAVPIALHLFRRRTEVVVDFPAVRLLTRAPVEQHRSRRLRELLLLALRVAALAAARRRVRAALRRAGHRLGDGADHGGGRRHVVEPVGPGDRWRRRARPRRRPSQAAPGSHAVALVAFADAAAVVVPATTDRGAVLAAIDGAAGRAREARATARRWRRAAELHRRA